jgi:hypothetical protein
VRGGGVLLLEAFLDLLGGLVEVLLFHLVAQVLHVLGRRILWLAWLRLLLGNLFGLLAELFQLLSQLFLLGRQIVQLRLLFRGKRPAFLLFFKGRRLRAMRCCRFSRSSTAWPSA